MNKVIIDKLLVNLDSPLSDGLISGLSKLSKRNFNIQIDEFSPDETLTKILDAERILINDSTGIAERTFIISNQEDPTNNKHILVSENSSINNFKKAADQVIKLLRSASTSRNTKETKIDITVYIDGEGKNEIRTGVGFFDHMLEQIARHANLDLYIKVHGDLHVDEHHTIEDTGITFGDALLSALGEKTGIKRYGFYLPMDETIARCAIDLGGRSLLNFKCKFSREKIGDFPTELTEEFFRGLASGLKANIYLRAKGKNDHHKIEAMFKAFAKSLNEACRLDERSGNKLPSTKGVL